MLFNHTEAIWCFWHKLSSGGFCERRFEIYGSRADREEASASFSSLTVTTSQQNRPPISAGTTITSQLFSYAQTGLLSSFGEGSQLCSLMSWHWRESPLEINMAVSLWVLVQNPPYIYWTYEIVLLFSIWYSAAESIRGRREAIKIRACNKYAHIWLSFLILS